MGVLYQVPTLRDILIFIIGDKTGSFGRGQDLSGMKRKQLQKIGRGKSDCLTGDTIIQFYG